MFFMILPLLALGLCMFAESIIYSYEMIIMIAIAAITLWTGERENDT